MNFENYTQDGWCDKFNMTSLQGYIDIEKRFLVELFGEPIMGSGDGKVTNEWMVLIEDEDGELHPVTIYDWKVGGNNRGDDWSDWHVGGRSPMATALLGQLLTELGRGLK